MKKLALGKISSECKCCGKKVDDLENHLLEYHRISPWTYQNIYLLRSDMHKTCSKCGKDRYLISPCIKDFYLPCCNNDKETYIIDRIKGLQEILKTNKYKQIIISSPGFLEHSLTYDIDSCSDIIKQSLKGKKILKDIYIGCYFKSGYPKEISERNGPDAIQAVTLDIPVKRNLSFNISNRKYKILLPETCHYDIRHHSRYSIFNSGQSKTRYTKRIKLEGNSCYKFWNNDNCPQIKSIFKIANQDSNNIPTPDLIFIKQILLRNKTTSNILWRIYNEILKYTKTISDDVLLKNTVTLFPSEKFDTKISWLPNFTPIDGINISIL